MKIFLHLYLKIFPKGFLGKVHPPSILSFNKPVYFLLKIFLCLKCKIFLCLKWKKFLYSKFKKKFPRVSRQSASDPPFCLLSKLWFFATKEQKPLLWGRKGDFLQRNRVFFATKEQKPVLWASYFLLKIFLCLELKIYLYLELKAFSKGFSAECTQLSILPFVEAVYFLQRKSRNLYCATENVTFCNEIRLNLCPHGLQQLTQYFKSQFVQQIILEYVLQN